MPAWPLRRRTVASTRGYASLPVRRFYGEKAGGKPVVLHTATLESRLGIIDAAAFTKRLLRGIGPAKSNDYDRGLFTLAPCRARERR
ncbi:type I-E CRISPR-associated protein Cas6/Cse3/CasE [Nonomuraea thailandensis]|uniref:type I-E CRISPR-associated protein Cas6/Cse3/CasE n=1 Tax=Nonomuraea thailandensis TaxID=1188745 RepID=UPI003621D584